MQSTNTDAIAATVSDAAAGIKRNGYFVFPNVLTEAEVTGLRAACRQFFKTGGRAVQGGGQKQANAAVEIPEIRWLFYHPAILSCFRQALETESIMYTSHSDVQKDVLGGWHKDDGTDEAKPDDGGYFTRHAYAFDDCRVYKMGVYLENHERDAAGLFVREGSHRCRSFSEGSVHYTGTSAGSVVLFDVRITHSGQFKSLMQHRMLRMTSWLPNRYVDAAFATARKLYRGTVGRERIAIFFTFGLPNDFTIEFAKANMRRQLSLTPGTSPRLPTDLRAEFEKNNVLLAEDHFTEF